MWWQMSLPWKQINVQWLSKEKEEQGLSYEATAAFKYIIPLDPPNLSMKFWIPLFYKWGNRDSER